MKKKALLVITKSNWGGAQRYIYDLARALSAKDFSVSVALGGTGEQHATPGLLAQRLHEAHINIVTVRAFMRNISLLQEFKAFFELYTLFMRERPDVVHLNSSKAGGLGALAARLSGVRVIIFTSHGLPYEEDRSAFERFFILLATWLTFILATRVIIISKHNFLQAQKLLFCKSKLRLIQNGVSPFTFTAKQEARQALLQTLEETSQPALWIGCIAEYTPNKGLLYLIEAAGILRKEGLSFVIFLIGEGSQRKELEKMISEEQLEDSVRLTGFVPEALQYLPSFDVFVLPSLKEGLPYVLLEAGQAGSAVVASNVGGIGDVIVQGETGLLCKAKDAKDLAAKLATLLKDDSLRAQLGKNLQEHVSQHFSHAASVEYTANLYSTES